MDSRIVRSSSRVIALILLAAACLPAGTKHSFPRPVLYYAHHPDLPLTTFTAGKLGLPAPEHARIYLFVAYRYFEDRPLTAVEQQVWMRVWKRRTSYTDPYASWAGEEDWVALRDTVPVGWDPLPERRDRDSRLPHYVSEPICAGDAFATAAATLRDRIARYGIRSAEVAFWVRGQDQVFGSCDPQRGSIPAPAPAAMPALLRADREYQIAAALLYSQRLEEAIAKFRTIAEDAASPWRVWAPYLIGRALLWEARLTQGQGTYEQKLNEAEAQFRAVLADRRLRITHVAAERLMIRCMMATRTSVALSQLGERMSRVNPHTLEHDLQMYLNGVDAYVEVDYPGDFRRVYSVPAVAGDDFSRWWHAFQSGSPRRFAEAVARWRSRQSKAWLYVALSLARGDAAEAEELIRAALAVPMEHAGGPALHFQAARLMGERREFERARGEADAVIGALEDLPSARNRALPLRAQLAATPAEFARLAPRRVIQHGMELDTREFEGHTYDGELAGLDRLDLATARVFSEKLPLDALAGLARDPASLPEHLHAELRLAAWTRAVLLHRWDVAREFVPAVSPERDRFLEDPSETTAAYLLLKLPGARPYMSVGYGRATPVDKHDEWVRNWWYRFTEKEMYRVDWQMNNEGSAPVLTRLAFLSDDEHRQAETEWRAMQSGERGLNWLALRIANDLRAHGERRDAPQVLYRVLEASNRGWWAWPPDGELTQPGLLAAWRLLSTRYPRSVWVQRARELQGAYVDQLK